MKPTLSHIAISASAGSGKTFQLADRFVHLLTRGVPPDRIAALTFSRKAAGEIFDRIVVHLCDASASPEGAQAVAQRIGFPDASPQIFTTALRALMDTLSRLHIGTLDSFIVGVLRAFPTELGVPPEFRMLDENGEDAMQMRERVLDRIFNPLSMDSSIQSDFFEAFKQATFGTEEKDMERTLHQLVEDYRAHYQVLPYAEAWGDATHIWHHASPWLEPVSNVQAIATSLSERIQAQQWPVKFETGLLRLIEAMATHTPESRWNALFNGTIMRRILEQDDALRRGDMELEYSRKCYALDADMCRDLFALLRHLIGTELRSALRRTSGIYELLQRFEVHYDTMMRRTGSLTFADAQYLLTEANAHSNGACLSRMAHTEGRLYIDYRLDCQLDHWMLDEFQDTSDLQWSVLCNLVDEIVQDTSQSRSFFYVGDVKQAIYGWRGGNPALFGEILARYPERIQKVPLATSYRSCPAIIDTVNALFDALPEPDLPPAVIEQWQQTWQRHDCAAHLLQQDGYATLIEPICPEGQKKPTADDRYALVAALLREINPVQRGQDTAILVRRNETARTLVDLLRHACPEIPVTLEGKATLRENGVVELFISLLAFAAHPGDRQAWRHIEMSPLQRHLRDTHLDATSLSLQLLRDLHTHGVADFVRLWGRHLNTVAPLSGYAAHCLDDLIEAAIQYDRSAPPDPDAFRRYIENHARPPAPAPNAVRIMTIHQSKGLGFDIVILPELDGDDIRRDTRRKLLLNRDPETRQPDWVLALGSRIVAEADPTLCATVEHADAQSCFESLCVLYVAATRAKRALYAVTSYPGPTATSLTAAEFMKQQLADHEKAITVADTSATQLYAHGRADWYTAFAPAQEALPDPTASSDAHTPQRRLSPDRSPAGTQLERLEPSASDSTPRRVGWLFSETARDVLQFGSAIHALFEQIEWIESADVDAIVARWQDQSDASARIIQDAAQQFRHALTAPEVRSALSTPTGPVTLWREKRFHYIHNERLVSGVFDRVTITLDADRPVAATILDYKSDQVQTDAEIATATERHRQQLTLYRDALALILDLSPDAIQTQLLYTRPARVIATTPIPATQTNDVTQTILNQNTP